MLRIYRSLITFIAFLVVGFSQEVTATPLTFPVVSLPGISPSWGDPGLIGYTKVSLTDIGGSYLLSATNAGAPVSFTALNAGSSTYVSSDALHPANYLLTAQFDSSGAYLAGTGTLRVSGFMPWVGNTFPYPSAPGAWSYGDLLTAQLDNFAFNSNLLGFTTTFISGVYANFGNKHESLYLSLAGIGSTLGFGSGSLVSTSSPITNVLALTTIPVPAAAWLFVSGLGLLGLRRKVA